MVGAKLYSVNIQTYASIVSSLIFVLAFSLYIRTVARGHVKVTVSTFSALALTSLSQAVALAIAGSWYASIFMVMTTIFNSLVVYHAVRLRNFEIKTLDKVSFVAAIIGLVAWYISNDPSMNVYILTAAVAVSFAPLLRKTFQNPETESALPWFLMFLASIFLAFTASFAEPMQWIVQARQFSLTLLMSIALSRKYLR